MNSKLLTVFLLILGILFGALMVRNGDIAWMALPFLLYLGIGIYLSPSPAAVRLKATRAANKTIGSEPGVDMRVKVINQGVAVDSLTLYDPLPQNVSLRDGCNAHCAVLRNGEETGLEYSFVQKRGSYQWREIIASVSDPFGLIVTRFALPAEAEIQVPPEHARFGRLPLHPRSTLPSPGPIPARLGGSGTDFWGVREYHPGDSLRWMDWRLTARHPGQFFTKEFEQEQIADIGLILDAREITDLRVADDSLFEHSVSAAASLAEVFLHQGQRVSLLVYSGHLQTVFPGYGKMQLNRILRLLSNVKTHSYNLADSLELIPLQFLSNHALVIVFSPLVHKDWPSFPRLRARGYQGLLISPNPYDFMAPGEQQDPAERLAHRAASLERSLMLRDITQLQIPVIDWKVRQPLYPLVRAAFGHIRGQTRGRGTRS